MHFSLITKNANSRLTLGTNRLNFQPIVATVTPLVVVCNRSDPAFPPTLGFFFLCHTLVQKTKGAIARQWFDFAHHDGG